MLCYVECYVLSDVLGGSPTAKEFKDAISSLSTEQQDFCKAFRGMQLSSTLFGVVVIQIKPQMEKLLNLPPDCLSREIALTEQLMEMFIKYQLPSDLLAFDQGEHEVGRYSILCLNLLVGVAAALCSCSCSLWSHLQQTHPHSCHTKLCLLLALTNSLCSCRRETPADSTQCRAKSPQCTR